MKISEKLSTKIFVGNSDGNDYTYQQREFRYQRTIMYN